MARMVCTEKSFLNLGLMHDYDTRDQNYGQNTDMYAILPQSEKTLPFLAIFEVICLLKVLKVVQRYLVEFDSFASSHPDFPALKIEACLTDQYCHKSFYVILDMNIFLMPQLELEHDVFLHFQGCLMVTPFS